MDAVRMGPLPFAYDVHTGLGVLVALLNEADSLLTRRRGRECRRVERERENGMHALCISVIKQDRVGYWARGSRFLHTHSTPTPYQSLSRRAHPPAGNPELL